MLSYAVTAGGLDDAEAVPRGWMLTLVSSYGEFTGEPVGSVAVLSAYCDVLNAGTLAGCVLFACTGITKAVFVSVIVGLAEATLAVDVKVVIPIPSLLSSVKVATGTSAEVNPRYSEPVDTGCVAEATVAPIKAVVLENVLLQVKLLSSYACRTVLV
jgi:uncharacterized spore protein YtfJ